MEEVIAGQYTVIDFCWNTLKLILLMNGIIFGTCIFIGCMIYLFVTVKFWITTIRNKIHNRSMKKE